MVRIDATADDSFAAMRARNRFGIAIAAMMRMMATTISNSISEKPFCFFIINIVLRTKTYTVPDLLKRDMDLIHVPQAHTLPQVLALVQTHCAGKVAQAV